MKSSSTSATKVIRFLIADEALLQPEIASKLAESTARLGSTDRIELCED
jgi:hypothetical protein